MLKDIEQLKTVVKYYCLFFGLNYVDGIDEPFDDDDEWHEVACSGFQEDPMYGACVITVSNVGQIQVVEKFADGRRYMEDKWKQVDWAALSDACRDNKPLHAV